MASVSQGGGATPLNFAVFCDFPAAELKDAVAYLFGENLDLTESERLGAGLSVREDVDFANDKTSFEHLRRFLTWRHEALHFRHLSGGVLGMVLYFVGGTQYNLMAKHLGAWGRRVADEPESDCRLPLERSRAGDPEMNRIADIRTMHGAMAATVMGGLDAAQLLETASTLGRPLMDFLVLTCEGVFGKREASPDLVADPADAALEPDGITGLAVLEGLARCNEYLLAVQLGANDKTLNRLFSRKHHGEYALAIDFVAKTLGLAYLPSTLMTAYCADLALQAPWLPFLLRGRTQVDFKELLPAWRFKLLVEGCKTRGLNERHFQDDPTGTAGALFDMLGWEAPRRLAERVLSAELAEPNFVLTRHYFRCLQEGARLRLTTPEAFVMPGQHTGTHLLEPVYYLFRDKVMPGSTGLLSTDPQYAELFLLLVDDAIVDDLLYRESLALSTVIAQRFYELIGSAPQARDEAEERVRGQLKLMVGPQVARRIVEGIGTSPERDQEDVASILTRTKLAKTVYEQGDYTRALEIQEEILKTCEDVLPPGHPTRLVAMNNLALTLATLGQMVRAEILQRKVLDAQLASNGEENASSLSAMINLATTRRKLGDDRGAQQLNQNALTIGRRIFGERHEITLTAANNFAMGLAQEGDYEKARALQQDVLAIRSKDLGEEHPESFRALNNLAHTLAALGSTDEAAALHRQSVKLHRQVHGDEHPETASAMSNLADLLASTGNLDEAEKLQRDVLETRRRTFGEEHPLGLAAMEALALTLTRNRQLDEARRLYQTALAFRDSKQGPQHPETTVTAYGLYAVVRSLGDSDRASSIREDYFDWMFDREPSTLTSAQLAVRQSLSR